MAFWNLAFLDAHRFRDTPGFSTEENRGAYLATALGHCGECHTPRNTAFAMDNGRQFAGTMIQGWHAYNITPDKASGVGGWSNQQLADYLKTGHGDGRGSAAGPMGEAVANSLQYLTPTDVAALVSYLRKVKPLSSEPANPVDVSVIKDAFADEPGPEEQNNTLGERIFAGNCAGCHLWNGQGRQTPLCGPGGRSDRQRPRRNEPCSGFARRRRFTGGATGSRHAVLWQGLLRC